MSSRKRNNLAVTSVYEERALAAHQVQKWPASKFTLQALRTAAALMQFMTFEAIANFMAVLAIGISTGKKSAPASVRPLHSAETDFLLEQDTILNPKTGEIRTRSNVFSASLDRFTLTPRLLGAIVGEECVVDKSSSGWQLVRALKDLRDGLTHPRIPPQSEQTKITSRDVFDGAQAVYWYLREIEALLIKVQANPEGWLLTTWMMLYHSRASAGFPEKEFQAAYPRPPAISNMD